MTLLFLLGLSLPGLAGASTADLFSTVPAGDRTYGQLAQLAKAGLLDREDALAPLTRYDVAKRILKADEKYEGIVLAQADMEIPPPPEDGAAPAPAQEAADNGAQAPAPLGTPAPEADDDASLAKAAENLRSLKEAYDSELTKLKDRLKALSDKVDQADVDQYDLRKRIKGITQFPSVSVHGIGRAFGISQQYWGCVPSYFVTPGTRQTWGYLDLGPEGQVSKEVGWKAVFRVQSKLSSNDSPVLTVRKVSMNFNPPWMSAVIGDFEEAYSPFTLWNRNSLDLAWAPEMWRRMDDQMKYESYFNDEPYWPLRGLRMGTELMWPDSQAIEELKTSVFAHMIRNGFDDTGSGTNWFFGPNQYTDWAFGARVSLRSPKWYLGGMSLRLSLDNYGTWLIEPLDSTQPNSPYGAFNPGTWAHQYLNYSVRPDLKAGLGGDLYIGGNLEYALSHYIDDEMDSRKTTDDFALQAGPYFQLGNSKLSFSVLDVGPYYYAPLAQTRQDAVTDLTGATALSFLRTPDLFTPALRGRTFLSNVTRPGGIYSFYDRTQDNTFPYGLGTPNRHGFGGNLDVKALKEDALKVKGSAYFVQEITSNLVVNSSGNAYIPLDTPPSTTLVPVRDFTYVNAGPSFDIGPFIEGWNRPLEIGVNGRYEKTSSVLGDLTSTWIVGGLRVGVLPVWEIAGAFSQQDVKGTDAGYGGTTWARYPYLFDNSDLGSYSTFTVKGNIQSLRLSNTFKVNRNSSIFLDWDWTTGTLLPANTAQGILNNHFMELSYEVKF